MKVTLMIEGQEGVSWADWQRLADLAEELGFEGLMRSDHYQSVTGASERGALDAWGTICALATQTERIRLGTLVSPVTFRPAGVLAKLALTADHVSDGRIDLGMGTGWFQGEHDTFGFTLPPMAERFDQLEQQVNDVRRFWRETGPAPISPRLILGGQAKRRAAALAAEHADEYNLLYATPDTVREKRGLLDDRLTLSMMTGFAIGTTQAEADERRARIKDFMGSDGNDTWLLGTPDAVIEQLGVLEAAGLDRVMLQHFVFSDDDVLRLIASEVLPAVASAP
jgi:alkanesulfonate monooxygenase SsuD/methylene tetrahydromethanopterin reductase-like flavin-dependent oxidoreductase (luciferase family)